LKERNDNDETKLIAPTVDALPEIKATYPRNDNALPIVAWLIVDVALLPLFAHHILNSVPDLSAHRQLSELPNIPLSMTDNTFVDSLESPRIESDEPAIK
jgi:hypothetical protein